MALTQNGIDYICQKFGDINECVVSGGLSWNYLDVEGTTHNETGATSSVVSRLIFPMLVVSLTMTNPPRGTFTYTGLRNANGGQDINLNDCIELDNHTEISGDQWCYTPPTICEDILNQTDCLVNNCYWYNNSCHTQPPECSPDGITKCEGYDLYQCVNGSWVLIEHNSEQCGYVPPECSPDGITKCEGYDLYTCVNGQWALTEVNSEACGYVPPTPPTEIPWLLIAGAGCAALGIIIFAIKKRG